MVFVDSDWRQCIARASETIQRCKWQDGLKGGSTVADIVMQMRNTERQYFHLREKVFYELQALNTDPNDVPIDLWSFDELIDRFGVPPVEEEIDLGNMTVIPWADPGHFLGRDNLLKITERWLEVNHRRGKEGVSFYYNETFIFLILRRYDTEIRNGNLDEINLVSDGVYKPLIYTHYPDGVCENEDLKNEIIKNFIQEEEKYKTEVEELSELEFKSSRGDFMLSREYPYGRRYPVDGKDVFQIESLMFFDFLNVLYLLSEQHPECFDHGAQAILNGLYEHYKEFLFGERQLDQSQFELKFTQQWLYMSDGNKELRIDLYRHLDPSKKGTGEDFIGGLFHAFNHFEGLQFAPTNESIELHEEFFLYLIRDIFFKHLPGEREVFKKGEQYIIRHEYKTPVNFINGAWKYTQMNWRATFYYSYSKKCFSFTTIHPE